MTALLLSSITDDLGVFDQVNLPEDTHKGAKLHGKYDLCLFWCSLSCTCTGKAAVFGKTSMTATFEETMFS